MLRTAIAPLFATLLAMSQANASDIRRIVTGVDADNKSTAMFDGRIPLVDASSDVGLAYLWLTDTHPAGLSPTADTRQKVTGVSPPDNGTQFGVVEFAPFDPANPATPAWHRTRSVDYVVVLSGEIDLMLDNSVVHLKTGDTVVQQATNHAWLNRGSEACRLLFVLLDAKRP